MPIVTALLNKTLPPASSKVVQSSKPMAVGSKEHLANAVTPARLKISPIPRGKDLDREAPQSGADIHGDDPASISSTSIKIIIEDDQASTHDLRLSKETTVDIDKIIPATQVRTEGTSVTQDKVKHNGLSRTLRSLASILDYAQEHLSPLRFAELEHDIVDGQIPLEKWPELAEHLEYEVMAEKGSREARQLIASLKRSFPGRD